MVEHDVRRDERHLGPAARRLRGDGDSHPPGRAVADEAHRVDRLARPAGRDQHGKPAERPFRAPQRSLDCPQNFRRLGEASHAPLAVRGKLAGARGDDRRPPLTQPLDVRPRGGVLPHVRVHRRREDERGVYGEGGARQQVVGETGGELRERVGRRWRNGEDLRTRGEREVRDRGVPRHVLARIRTSRRVALELFDQDRSPGDPLEGGAADELEARGGLHDAHAVARLDREPGELDRLVRGDAAADAEQDPRHLAGAGASCGSGS